MSKSDSPSLPLSGTPPKGALGAIFLIILVDFMGFGLIIPLLPFFIPDYENAPLKVTLLFAIFSICQFIGAPILGALSDRYGRRPVLILSQIGSAAGYILLGVAATDFFGWSDSTRLGLVYLSRIIDGFTGGNVSIAQAYISDVTDEKNRAKGMGLIGAAFGIGFSLGPALGFLLVRVDPALPGYAAAALAAWAAIQTWARLPESPVHKPTEVQHWLHPRAFAPVLKSPIVRQLLFISFISMAAFVMMEATVAIFLSDVFNWGQGMPDEEKRKTAGANTGLFFVYIGIIIVIVQGGLIRRLTKKGLAAEWRLATLGPILVTLGMALFIYLAWLPAIWVLALAGLFNATGRSFQGPTLSSLLSKYSDPRQQGAVFGLYHGLSSLARVAGPIIAGFAYHMHPSLRKTGQFWIAGIALLLIAIWTAMIQKRALRDNPLPAASNVSQPEATAQAARAEVE